MVKEHSFTVSCLNKNRRPSTKVVSNSVVTVRGELMHKLQLPGPTQMVRLVRIRYVDGAPAIYEEDYFPMKYEMLLGMQLDDRSIFGFLAEEMNIFRATISMSSAYNIPAHSKRNIWGFRRRSLFWVCFSGCWMQTAM